jgi:hypothetical protein
LTGRKNSLHVEWTVLCIYARLKKIDIRLTATIWPPGKRIYSFHEKFAGICEKHLPISMAVRDRFGCVAL